MRETAGDLEKLLSDVRKTIQDNQKFLQILASDAADVNSGLDSSDEESEGRSLRSCNPFPAIRQTCKQPLERSSKGCLLMR